MDSSLLQSVSFYAKRPVMWGEFGRAVVNKFRDPVPDERGAATTSCHQAAVPKQEALEELGIRLVDVTEFEQYQDARKRLAEKGITIAGAADSAFLYSICQQLKPESVLETGVAHGMSSLAILLAMNETASGHLTSIDMPYRGSTDDSYVGQAVPESLRSRWSLLKLPDRRGIPLAIARGASFDLVHYDSDKTRSGREFAYPLLWEATTPGGLFLSDDINDDFVFLEFAEKVGVSPLIWAKSDDNSYAGAIAKPV